MRRGGGAGVTLPFPAGGLGCILQQSIENWLKIRSLGRRPTPLIPIVMHAQDLKRCKKHFKNRRQ